MKETRTYISKYPHGLMFHHFHNQQSFKRSQGSISKNQFEKIIKYVGVQNILSPREFIEKKLNNNLRKNDFCITFDDGLKCQFEIALPILKKYELKAFFFVYTSIFENSPDKLEIYREFRNSNFKNINDFYNEFFSEFEFIKKIGVENALHKHKDIISQYRRNFSFYSEDDIKFRILRDFVLGKKLYEKIIDKMMNDRKINLKNLTKKIYLSKNDVTKLSKLGHEIGLHSHTHPTFLEKLPQKNQKFEYQRNLNILKKFSKNNLISMSHPCGSYNKNTLKILKNLNIKIGFKQIIGLDNRVKKINNSDLEIAREDHANLLKQL